MSETEQDLCFFLFNPLLLPSISSLGQKQDALTVAAMLTVQNPFLNPRGAGRERRERVREAMEEFAVTEGDHITYLNVYNCFEAAGSDGEWCEENCLNYRALVRAGEIRQQLARLFVLPFLPNLVRKGERELCFKLQSGYHTPSCNWSFLVSLCSPVSGRRLLH